MKSYTIKRTREKLLKWLHTEDGWKWLQANYTPESAKPKKMSYTIAEIKKMKKRKTIKDIEGWGGMYAVTCDGKVYSLRSERFLKPRLTQSGYYRVYLVHKKRRKHVAVHRLVSEAFIPNPNNYPQVNHLDGDKQDNHFSNLEWCTSKENIHHGIKMGLIDPKKGIAVGQFTLGGKLVAEFRSLVEAGRRIHCCRHGISDYLNGLKETVAGYKWKSLEELQK